MIPALSSPALWAWWPLVRNGLGRCDSVVAGCLFPLALIILISGLDDLALAAICLWAWVRGSDLAPPESQPSPATKQKTIAIFVPLWHEHAVIAGMVEHNIAAINYENYHFFVGAYPNDDPTLDAVRDLESRFARVHLAVCPHNGPTSKADCLNWIYQRMLLFEEHHTPEHKVRFDIVVTHDAEDLIHPEALSFINACADEYDMVQIPVLPLPTPMRDFVHGIYCDEFAEWQTKDMRARQIMGSFLPSNGVGTGYTRRALEMLASSEHNLIFEPACLTEDYENGLRLHKLQCRQRFVPLTRHGAGMVATREFFPRTARGGHPAALTLDSGHRTAMLGAQWLAWRLAREILVLARSQRPARQSHQPAQQLRFPVRHTHLGGCRMHGSAVGTCAIFTLSVAAGSDARDPNHPNYGAHELLRPAVWIEIRPVGTAARGVWQLDQHGFHLQSRSIVCNGPDSPRAAGVG